MNLREWTSNSDPFLTCLPEKERTKGNVLKVFGLVWNREKDYVQIPEFSVSYVKEASTSVSKRQVLSDVAKLYDPLGLISPFAFLDKILLQKLWGPNRFSWDEELPVTFKGMEGVN